MRSELRLSHDDVGYIIRIGVEVRKDEDVGYVVFAEGSIGTDGVEVSGRKGTGNSKIVFFEDRHSVAP